MNAAEFQDENDDKGMCLNYLGFFFFFAQGFIVFSMEKMHHWYIYNVVFVILKVKVVTVDSSSEEVRLRRLHAPYVGKVDPECTVNCHSSKRKQTSLMSNGSSGEAENLTTLKKRRLTQEVNLNKMSFTFCTPNKCM